MNVLSPRVRASLDKERERPSARSGDLPWNGQMLVTRTTEKPGEPPRQARKRPAETLGLEPLRACPVHPFGLYRVLSHGLRSGKTAASYDPRSSFAALFDLAVVLAEPAPYLAAYAPARVVPNEEQDLLAAGFELLGAPSEEPRLVLPPTGRPSADLKAASDRAPADGARSSRWPSERDRL